MRKSQLNSAREELKFLQTRDNVGFDIFTAVTMKNAVFCDLTPCGSCNNRRVTVVSYC
jgi:hypothetical protein